MLDKIKNFKDEPFCFKGCKERVSIFFKESEVVVLKGTEASNLFKLLSGEEDYTKQLILAQFASRSTKK